MAKRSRGPALIDNPIGRLYNVLALQLTVSRGTIGVFSKVGQQTP